MDEQLLKKPYTEKLYVKPNLEQFPEGKLEFTNPDGETDGEFLRRSSHIDGEKLNTYMQEKDAETKVLLEKYKAR